MMRLDRSRQSDLGTKSVLWLLAATTLFLLSACGGRGGAPVISRGSRDIPPSAPIIRSDHYLVRRGDTLYSIAWKMGLDFRKLARWNHIAPPYTIYPGQRLRLKPALSRTAANTTAKSTPGGGKAAISRTKPTTSQKTGKSSSTSLISRKKAVKSSRPPAPARRLRWSWPTDGKVVQGFSKRDPTRKGLKINGRLGQPVRAAEAGKIVYSGSGLIGYGKLIIIKHDKNFLSAYGHNRKILVTQGDEVSKGERIAEMGVAAGATPVLHFEIRRNGKPVDPVPLLPPRR